MLHQLWSTGWNSSKEIAQWVYRDGSTRRPISPLANTLIAELHLAPLGFLTKTEDARTVDYAQDWANSKPLFSLIKPFPSCMLSASLNKYIHYLLLTMLVVGLTLLPIVWLKHELDHASYLGINPLWRTVGLQNDTLTWITSFGGIVAKLSPKGLVGKEVASRYWLQPRAVLF